MVRIRTDFDIIVHVQPHVIFCKTKRGIVFPVVLKGLRQLAKIGLQGAFDGIVPGGAEFFVFIFEINDLAQLLKENFYDQSAIYHEEFPSPFGLITVE